MSATDVQAGADVFHRLIHYLVGVLDGYGAGGGGGIPGTGGLNVGCPPI
jgi:hypothetical protein